MGKRGRIILLACCMLLLPCQVLAQVYEGVTVSAAEQRVTMPGGGTLAQFSLRVGQTVSAGEQVGQVAPQKVFATQDGVVASVSAQAGQEASGAVLALEPAYRYVVYCTVSGAYDAPETKLIHSGEQVYLRCVKNGTHRAVGLVTAVTAEEYTVEIIGGELYVGEAVAVYREESFAAASCLGKGTVIASPAEEYAADGVILTLRVQPGDRVQRGQLLFTWAEDAQTAVLSPISGVVTSVSAAKGDPLAAEDAVAGVTAWEDILLEITVEDAVAVALNEGQAVTYTAGCDPAEEPRAGRIVAVDALACDGFRVQIAPDIPEARVGMSVSVTLGGT